MLFQSITIALALSLASAVALAGTRIIEPSTALVVAPLHEAHHVRGDDGRTHVEYDLLVTNVFDGAVTVTTLEITNEAGKVIGHIDGRELAQATQTLIDGKPARAIPPSGSVAIEVDLVLPAGMLPTRLSHRLVYDFAQGDPLASLIGSREVVGVEVAVSKSEPVAIIAPLTGPGWVAFNGCCVPNIHRNVRVAAGTRIATPETFAIDWIQVEGDKFFEGDGKANKQFPYFGAEVRSVADGEVVAVRDGMPEGQPFMAPKTVKAPGDYAGNHVIVRIRPDVYALYAHLQQGKIAVKLGDKVKAGARIGKLGNSGNSSAPHLHFGLLDRPDPLTGNSLPFVIDHFDLTGKVEAGEENQERRTLMVTPASGKVEAAYPLVRGIATFR
jgi:Peptidase family M23